MRIYLASSWRNRNQQEVVTALRAAGHDVYDFKNPGDPVNEPPRGGGAGGFRWSDIDPAWQTWTAAQQVEAYKTDIAKSGFGFDFTAMQWAHVCVMLQPCGRSAALELGWACGAGKKTIVLMAEGQEPELMLRLADHLCLSVEEVIEVLARR